MQLIIDAGGQVRCLYSETLDLAALGSLTIARASHVEPDSQGNWLADLAPVSGPVLGPFLKRSDALAAEAAWLERHWLLEPLSPTTTSPPGEHQHGTHDPLPPEDFLHRGR